MTTVTKVLGWWGYAAAKALGEGGAAYRIRKLYVEYENVVSPSDAVSIPGIDPMNPGDGRAYYDGLSMSPRRDYLRINLASAPVLSASSGFEGFFGAGQGNQLTFFGQAADSSGQNGRPFNASSNSKVCGIAIVVAPVEDDPTQDIVVSRSYFDTSEQKLKVAGLQLGVTCDVPFVLPVA